MLLFNGTRSALTLILALTLSAVSNAGAAEVVSSMGGTVLRAGGRSEPARPGTLINDGDTLNGDATVSYSDGSTFELSQDGEFHFAHSSNSRTITIVSEDRGQILANVTPGTSTKTKIKTVAGECVIKGTTLTITINSDGSASFRCDSGTALWNLPGQSAYFYAPSGTNVRVDKNPDGTFTVQNFGGAVDVKIEYPSGYRQVTSDSTVASGGSKTVSAILQEVSSQSQGGTSDKTGYQTP